MLKHCLRVSMLTSIFFAATSITSALAEAPRAAAVDAQGLPVLTSAKECVRTQWEESSDACAPKVEPTPAPIPVAAPAPAPEPAPAPKVTLEQMKEARTVYFGFNKSDIEAKDQQELDALVDVLKSSKEVSGVRVVGYADRIGSIKDNDALSQRRAKAVEAYLHSHDYMKTSVSDTRWLGESAPATECAETLKRAELIECLGKDRRVEIEVDYVKEVTN